MLQPPPANAPEIVRAVWRASGPGRAWGWRAWARGVKRSDPHWSLAQATLAEVRAIRHWYARGANDQATLLVNRLGGRLRGAIEARHQRIADAAKGGSKSARRKKNAASAWQTAIERRVRRLIAAGKTSTNIAVLIVADRGTPPSVETVRRFVDGVRQKLAEPQK